MFCAQIHATLRSDQETREFEPGRRQPQTLLGETKVDKEFLEQEQGGKDKEAVSSE